MKRLLFFILHSSLFIGCAMAQPLMRDVFAAMPDSILPMVTRNNRLDCIDFIENNMEAKVRNVADEYVTLEALTKDYARFRTSAAAVMELKLLHVEAHPQPLPEEGNSDGLSSSSTSLVTPPLGGGGGGLAILCLVTTAQTGEPDTPRRLEDSNIRFLYSDWTPLDSATAGHLLFSMPPVKDFLGNVSSEDSEPTAMSSFEQALRSLADFHPVRLALSPEAPTLTATLQPAYLALEERKAITPRLCPLTFRWNGGAFVVSASE